MKRRLPAPARDSDISHHSARPVPHSDRPATGLGSAAGVRLAERSRPAHFPLWRPSPIWSSLMALLGVGGFGWVAIGGVLSPSAGNTLAQYLPVSLYGAITLSYLGIQVFFAWLEHRRQRRVKRAASYPAVTVVLPTYNQPPEDLRDCIESVARQDYPGMLQLIVVDDGSRRPPSSAALGLHRFAGQSRCAELIHMPRNGGKRRAQKAAFDRAVGSYIVTIDDDTSLALDALSRLVDLMESDQRIGAASASIRVRNRRALFTALIDLRYWASNHLERASQSYLGVLNCCSGPLAIYRIDVVARVKDEYIGQRFLGKECIFGDDRHLTNLTLREGYHVRFAPAAHAWTACPERIGIWLRQQRRWSKSFYRETWWSLRFVHRRNVYFGYNLLVGALLPFLLAYGLFAAAAHAVHAEWWVAGRYLATVIVMGWIRGICGLVPTGDRTFLLMPIYAFLHLALVVPVRALALFTMWDNRWGTR